MSTLKDLVETGDEIVKIEGIFSGTLSYLFNNYSSLKATSEHPQSFTEIVKVAKDKGYTEPDPRDDLNGMDVARKVVILGRVAGIDLSLDSLSVENIGRCIMVMFSFIKINYFYIVSVKTQREIN